MRLLVDSDLFCKLGASGLLPDAAAALGTDLYEWGRLAALPHMLRRGRLVRVYGSASCSALIPIANKMQAISATETKWLDRLTSVHEIDPGEAQLFAAAAQDAMLVATGDKRALNALKHIDGFAEALSGRIVVLEAILLLLCDRLGQEEVRRRVLTVATTDRMLAICFSAATADPRVALDSYHRDLAAEVLPLTLWNPRPGGASV